MYVFITACSHRPVHTSTYGYASKLRHNFILTSRQHIGGMNSYRPSETPRQIPVSPLPVLDCISPGGITPSCRFQLNVFTLSTVQNLRAFRLCRPNSKSKQRHWHVTCLVTNERHTADSYPTVPTLPRGGLPEGGFAAIERISVEIVPWRPWEPRATCCGWGGQT